MSPMKPLPILNRVLTDVRNVWYVVSGSTGSGDRRPDLDQVLPAARAFTDPDEDDRLTGLHAVLRQSTGRTPDELIPARARFEQRVDRDPERKRRLDEAEEEMARLQATDATEHFLMISGYSEEELPGMIREPSTSYRANHPGAARHRDRKPARKSFALKPGVLAVLGLFCLFSLGSYGSDPLAGPIAELTDSGSILFGNLGGTVRGHREAAPEEQQVAMMAALDQIDQSRTSILGFYTGYERDALLEAMVFLDQAIRVAPLTEPVAAELIRLRNEVSALVVQEQGDQNSAARYP